MHFPEESAKLSLSVKGRLNLEGACLGGTRASPWGSCPGPSLIQFGHFRMDIILSKNQNGHYYGALTLMVVVVPCSSCLPPDICSASFFILPWTLICRKRAINITPAAKTAIKKTYSSIVCARLFCVILCLHNSCVFINREDTYAASTPLAIEP